MFPKLHSCNPNNCWYLSWLESVNLTVPFTTYLQPTGPRWTSTAKTSRANHLSLSLLCSTLT
nr:uncharacterized protein CTRU02_05790 [Colletotrichum truncatum]KAF6793535.1 hypothetical protein CTRU02_05790 [Colletotrichum truncatum]